MGMHRWLLGPLICLILATTSARPPECQPAPPWSISGQQPLAETKGKASMLEALSNHFRSYGMDDLEFIIVNSKMSHAQEKLHELTRRVSFNVYQETDEEEVWSVMEGGKDDMYVYDRCGRLTYYIPFPLSILNESPLVSNAILATYFRSPCGEKCDTNTTFDIEDIVKNMENDFENANETMQENSTDTGVEQSIYVTETLFEGNKTSNDTNSNDLFSIINSIDSDTDDFSTNSTKNSTDYDYPSHTNNPLNNETDARLDKANTFFNRIYKLFFNNGNDSDAVTESKPTNNSFNQLTSTEIGINNEVSTHHLDHETRHHDHHKHSEAGRNDKDKKKSDRCLEADFEVCKSWSKNRLLHAQKCCTEVVLPESGTGTRKPCAHFGKKRCKKIQSILKCCIKTVYTEPTAETKTQVDATRTVDSTTDATVETSERKTETVGAVCCRPTEKGRLCRVSNSETCEEGELLQESSSSLP